MQLIKRMRVVPVDEGVYIMLNGITGTMELIDELAYKTYLRWHEAGQIHPTTENMELFDNFHKQGYIMEPLEEDERFQKLLKHLEHSYAAIKSPVNPVFVLTYDCNFRCSYCYEKKVYQKGLAHVKRRMNPETVQRLFRFFAEGEMTVGDMTLFGGEPLLLENEATVREIIKQANERNVFITVVTNGYTLEYYLPILATAKVKSIQITIDGDRERHNRTRFAANRSGTFDHILQGILANKKYRLPINLRCNIEMDEEDQVEKLLKSLSDYGLGSDDFKKMNIMPVCGEDRDTCSNNFWTEYLEKIEPYINHPIGRGFLADVNSIAVNFIGGERWVPQYMACNAHFGKQVFDPWGYIYPCQSLVGDETQVIGIFDEVGIHYNDNYSMWKNRNISTIEECRNCAMALFCGGGCAIGGERSGGKIGPAGCSQMEATCDILLPYLYKKFVKK